MKETLFLYVIEHLTLLLFYSGGQTCQNPNSSCPFKQPSVLLQNKVAQDSKRKRTFVINSKFNFQRYSQSFVGKSPKGLKRDSSESIITL